MNLFGTGVPLLTIAHNVVFKFFEKEREVAYECDYGTQVLIPASAQARASAPTLATIITNNNYKNLGGLLAPSAQTFEKEGREGFEALLSAIDTANNNLIRGLFAALFNAIDAAIIGMFTTEFAGVLYLFIGKILGLLGYAIVAKWLIAPIVGAYIANTT